MRSTIVWKSTLLALGLAVAVPMSHAWADQPGKGQDKAAEKKAKPDDKAAKAEAKDAKAAAKDAAKDARAAAKDAKDAEKQAGGMPGEPGDVGGDEMSRNEAKFNILKKRATERRQFRERRKQVAKAQMRRHMRAVLRGKPLPESAKQELVRHARRQARIQRIIELATEAKDVDSIARAQTLLIKEQQRHRRWMENFMREQRGVPAPGAEPGTATGVDPAPAPDKLPGEDDPPMPDMTGNAPGGVVGQPPQPGQEKGAEK